jgi:hypothetical protein
MRIPESKDKVNFDAIKWRRYNFATHDSGRTRADFRPRKFLKTMKFEVAIICGGIFMGLSKQIFPSFL